LGEIQEGEKLTKRRKEKNNYVGDVSPILTLDCLPEKKEVSSHWKTTRAKQAKE